ncbi:papain-like cysteine protease family protein [Erythrobacter colymbi]|uniref:papain-like cysteine protease family protein n=1 Tax=Erythrobacter colymbi TaxID=1161202 RepID=UPI000A3B6A5D|nr:papain-like cysteine protease family protein [Erythrobacter colymbi]
MRSLIIVTALAGAAAVVGTLGGEAPAAAQSKCDKLTGRDKSRCLMDERRAKRAPETPAPRATPAPRSTPAPRATPAPSAARPATPRALSPGAASAPGQTVSGNRVTITWAPVSGATEYDFGIRDITTDQLVVDTRSPETSYTAPITRGRSYRWNVRACNAAGCSTFSAPLYFQSEGAPSVGAITLPVTFPLYNQRVASAAIYQPPEWANALDEGSTTNTHADVTCLAVVYAMIEHARGNRSYRIGPSNWTPVGIKAISGIGGQSANLTADIVLGQLRKGNPVILSGPFKGGVHYILAVGTNASGQIIAHDPWGGVRVTVNPQTWAVTGSTAIKGVSGLRTVTF